MMYILGISAFYHDSAAVLVKDGNLVCATEEERFTRVKHDNSFPYNAINYCLKYVDGDINKIRYVAYYEKPFRKFDRIVHMFLDTYPFSFKPFIKSFPEFVSKKLDVEKIIRKDLGYKGKILFVPHHVSHASGAFFVSPFKKAAILTIDGVGEWQTTGLYLGVGNKIIPLKKIDFPHSVGLFYSTITAFLGFKVNNDEYKVMGLSAYGNPDKYYKKLMKVIEIKDDGGFRLNMKYFAFTYSMKMWSNEMEKLLGKPRKPGEKIKQRHADIAAALQRITEEIYIKILNYLYSITKTKKLVLAGGVALNCVANGKIYENTPFKKVFVQGAAGDSGGALGAAFFVWNHLLKRPRKFVMRHMYWGPEYDNEYVESFLEMINAKYEKLERRELVKKVARLLAKNKVIGWFQGKLEFGPRALGSRSILANPKHKWMKDRVNEIKRREYWRPFAGSVLQERVHELFYVPEKNHYSPFMIFAFRVKEGAKKKIAAIVHKNNTCRVQTVNRRDNGIYYDIIKEFYRLTNIPIVLNTSFNLKGEPIVNTPEQAYRDFMKTNMDYLVINEFFIKR